MSREEIKFIIKNSLQKQILGPDSVTGEYYQTFKENRNTPYTFVYGTDEKTLLNCFYEASISWYKISTQTLKCWKLISLMNTDTNILHKTPVNWTLVFKKRPPKNLGVKKRGVCTFLSNGEKYVHLSPSPWREAEWGSKHGQRQADGPG